VVNYVKLFSRTVIADLAQPIHDDYIKELIRLGEEGNDHLCQTICSTDAYNSDSAEILSVDYAEGEKRRLAQIAEVKEKIRILRERAVDLSKRC